MYYILLFVLLFFNGQFLFSEITPYLKKVENKSNQNSMKGIDYIYVINLDQRPEKWNMTKNQLNKFGINAHRFSAVNGWELTKEAINDLGVKYQKGMKTGIIGTSYITDDLMPTHGEINNPGQTYFVHCMARGTIGIVLSHMSILRDALESGYDTIWVMEDDIEVMQDPRKISKLIKKLDKLVGKKNWDVLFTDVDIRAQNGDYVPCYGAAPRPNFTPQNPSKFKVKQKMGKDFVKVGARFGATSMIIRKRGIKKIYNFINKYGVFLPYDMDYYLPEGINLFSLQYDVVTNLQKALSDNGVQGYLNKKD